ncbi:energy-coupling factor transporter transmembrane protein EcfT [Paenibacillus sp. PsM32]|uniref:energy-coupling factor transporter transmembrane component T family protein n=1 Tax=Paenibacillus sp. PsM32 TaxID=3030536 RepID=UPI00263BDBD8|nr:energy-coupling factor transporter transmembrane protein EcfT [Paenibacillus sp. PsM32]MDN4619356.1 energy-coupling factor transporter transmembrane protein EcfT [Paenibacillus sp. PsM32]
MSNQVLIGQYIETHSIFHRLDPRIKLISLLILMLSFIGLHTGISYLIASVFVIGLVYLTRIPVVVFWHGLKPLWIILLFTFAYHLLFTQGHIIWSWGWLEITTEGVQNGGRFVWRIVLLILLAAILTLTTQPLTLAYGLQKLMSPLSKLNVPVEQFSLMIVIAIRFIPTILEELERILLAQKARGYDITTLRFPQRILAYIPILVPLLFTIVQRAEHLSDAIDARAYGNGKGRTSYRQLHLHSIDYIVIGIAIVFAVSLLLLNIMNR